MEALFTLFISAPLVPKSVWDEPLVEQYLWDERKHSVWWKEFDSVFWVAYHLPPCLLRPPFSFLAVWVRVRLLAYAQQPTLDAFLLHSCFFNLVRTLLLQTLIYFYIDGIILLPEQQTFLFFTLNFLKWVSSSIHNIERCFSLNGINFRKLYIDCLN